MRHYSTSSANPISDNTGCLTRFPQDHYWNSNRPCIRPGSGLVEGLARSSRRAGQCTYICQYVALDSQVQAHIQRTSGEETHRSTVEVLSGQLRDVSGNHGYDCRSAPSTPILEGSEEYSPTAKRGNTSIEFRCAPLALARWFHSCAGSLAFQASRLVLGIALLC